MTRFASAQLGGASRARVAMSGRMKLELELKGATISGISFGAHTATWANDADHWGCSGRPWGVSGARSNAVGRIFLLVSPPYLKMIPGNVGHLLSKEKHPNKRNLYSLRRDF